MIKRGSASSIGSFALALTIIITLATFTFTLLYYKPEIAGFLKLNSDNKPDEKSNTTLLLFPSQEESEPQQSNNGSQSFRESSSDSSKRKKDAQIISVNITSEEELLPSSLKSHNFQFYFDSNGFLKELNWTGKRIILDEQGRFGSAYVKNYLHSRASSSSLSGWSYISSGNEIKENHDKISYSKLYEDNNSVVIKAETSSIEVLDTIIFSGNEIKIETKITNKLNKKIKAKIPVHLGSLQLSDDSRKRLRATAGGFIQSWSGENAQSENSYNYPEQISVYSPVSALFDSQFTIGAQLLNKIYLPDSIEFTEIPKDQFSERMTLLITSELSAGESRSYNIVFKLSNSGNWQDALSPYKEWFNQNYGSTPDYCPTGAFAYFNGRNSCTYNHYDSNLNCDNYNASLGERYHAGSTLTSIYGGNIVLQNMNSLGIEYYGIWASSIHSTHITNDESSFEFNPNIELLDPNIDASSDPQKISGFAALFHTQNKKIFWFARPCQEISGANIEFVSGSPQITKGDIKYNLDLRKEENRNRVFQRLNYFVSRGIDGFYFDAMSCPGDEEFIKYAKNEFKSRYGKDIFIVKEGARDRDSLLWPQIPILKYDAGYIKDNSVLINYLVPQGTYYGGQFNNHLSDQEISDIFSKGYQPIVGNHLFSTDAKQVEWMAVSQINKNAKSYAC